MYRLNPARENSSATPFELFVLKRSYLQSQHLHYRKHLAASLPVSVSNEPAKGMWAALSLGDTPQGFGWYEGAEPKFLVDTVALWWRSIPFKSKLDRNRLREHFEPSLVQDVAAVGQYLSPSSEITSSISGFINLTLSCQNNPPTQAFLERE